MMNAFASIGFVEVSF